MFSIGLAKPIFRPNWLNTEEAAEYIGCSVKGLYKLIQRGVPYCPRYYQVGKGSPVLFKKAWLDDFIESKSQPEPVKSQPLKPKGRKPKTAGQLSPWWEDLETGRS